MTSAPAQRRQRPTELHLLRYLPGASPLHRMWPGTKVVIGAALGVAVGLFPTWPAAAALAALVGIGMLVGHIPVGVFPRLPRWFWIGVALTAGLSMLSRTPPKATVLGINISLGALDEWTRLSVLAALIFLAAALVGWTTPMADLPASIRSLMRPLRLVRVPVDELSVAIALAARCIPLLMQEVMTLGAARRVRRPTSRPSGHRTMRRRVQQAAEVGVDLLVTAMASALRRAGEMAEAMEARGATAPAPAPVRVGWSDAVAVVLTAAAIAVMVVF